MSTRTSVRQSLAKAAETAIIKVQFFLRPQKLDSVIDGFQPGVHFSRLQALQSFIELAGYNPAIGSAVEELTISLPPQEGYPAETVRRCLELTPNVETLILDLPSTSPLSIFNGIRLVKLTVFSTNLPHRLLPTFLDNHPTIDALVLRSCGRGAQCPLQGLELRELSNLQCPSRCFAGIIRGRLTTATINLTRLASLTRIGLRSLSSTRLNTLTVDFYPDDYDILAQVAAMSPNLQHLKLNEKPRPAGQLRSGHSRRPWNDLQAWHRLLLKMPVLEELMLRTLIPIATPPRTEFMVVLGWVNGTSQRTTAHPALIHVGIIQRAPEGGQVRNRWLKRDTGIWERVTSHAVGPHDTFSAL